MSERLGRNVLGYTLVKHVLHYVVIKLYIGGAKLYVNTICHAAPVADVPLYMASSFAAKNSSSRIGANKAPTGIIFELFTPTVADNRGKQNVYGVAEFMFAVAAVTICIPERSPAVCSWVFAAY